MDSNRTPSLQSTKQHYPPVSHQSACSIAFRRRLAHLCALILRTHSKLWRSPSPWIKNLQEENIFLYYLESADSRGGIPFSHSDTRLSPSLPLFWIFLLSDLIFSDPLACFMFSGKMFKISTHPWCARICLSRIQEISVRLRLFLSSMQRWHFQFPSRSVIARRVAGLFGPTWLDVLYLKHEHTKSDSRGSSDMETPL